MTARQPRPADRVGQLIGALVNAVLLWLVNVQPGWDAVPFLTEDTPQVLPLVNLSIVAGLLTNLVYLVNSGPRIRALGGLITSAVGLVAAARVLQIFPLDLEDPYATVARILLVIAVIGSAIAIVVNLVSLFTADRSTRPPIRTSSD